MATTDPETIDVVELREGDVCDFTAQVAKYDIADTPQILGRDIAIGNPAKATIKAALLRLGHDQVVIVSDEISLALPTGELVRRLSRGHTPS